MNFSEIVVEWLWYVIAFAAGGAVAWLIVTWVISPRSEEEAFSDVASQTVEDAR